MKQNFAFAVMLAFGLTSAVVAQSMSADEKAIRERIAASAEGAAIPFTGDAVVWTGRYKQPFVRGGSTAQLMTGEDNRVGTRTKYTVRRLEISQSADMAYEFSDGDVTAQTKDASGKVTTETFKNSVLRVWQKVNGQWNVAATFARPHEQ